ncbi:hypothetical protein Syun_004267 [Stephania yunnanensis]|uniref:Uncharacterized protein n=1 Tax=Stephania yunnanensis TaxID=152371 RepID=A0AAP0L588_9MAGN
MQHRTSNSSSSLLIVLAIFYVGRPLYWKALRDGSRDPKEENHRKKRDFAFCDGNSEICGMGEGELEVGDASGKSSGIALKVK